MMDETGAVAAGRIAGPSGQEMIGTGTETGARTGTGAETVEEGSRERDLPRVVEIAAADGRKEMEKTVITADAKVLEGRTQKWRNWRTRRKVAEKLRRELLAELLMPLLLRRIHRD
jgi:hypothetical protein